LLNGLVPFIWFILWQSNTRAGLTKGTHITSFQWLDSNNASLRMVKHPTCNGFQFLENTFLSITAAVTATITLDAYALRWSILTLSPDGQLSIDN